MEQISSSNLRWKYNGSNMFSKINSYYLPKSTLKTLNIYEYIYFWLFQNKSYDLIQINRNTKRLNAKIFNLDWKSKKKNIIKLIKL